MSILIENMKRQFRSGSMTVKLIMINVAFFVVTAIVSIVLKSSNSGVLIQNYYGASADFVSTLFKPWTLVTYMFAHDLGGIGHLFWNMVMLYFAGNFFIAKLGNKKLLSVYLVGGFSGYLLFALGYNLLPAFSESGSGILIGASAAVTAIFVTIGVLYPNHEMRLMFIPQPIKLMYIVGFFILLDIIRLQSSIGVETGNAGGWLAHIGGAIFAFIYASRIKEGKSILKRFERFLGSVLSLSFMNIFLKKKGPKLRVKKGGKDKKVKAKQSTTNKMDVDAIINKVKNSGYESLTKNEKDRLFSQSKK